MTKASSLFIIFSLFSVGSIKAQSHSTGTGLKNDIVKTANGLLQGFTDQETGIKNFWGIQYAQPPVGPLRWHAPQPVKSWQGIRKADHFGPRAMQEPVFGDMRFRTDSMSEDCLYLNVWTPAQSPKAHLPVLVYFYGGGFVAGDGSEWRYDGASLAQKGIVVVTVNYRLGIFGFFAYPELTKESPHHASGNYGLLDQHAAIEWVRHNIAAFGGNPDHITIGGESAGSISVFAQMASPLSKNLIAGAIGESGAMINPTLPPIPLSEAEKRGVDFALSIGAHSLKDLRAIPAKELSSEASKKGIPYFSATIDGYFFPRSPLAIFEEGRQAHVPLLVGWNSTEAPYMALMRGEMPSPENYAAIIKQLYKDKADQVLRLYPGNTRDEVIQSATDLASDGFIVYSTWKWAELQRETGKHPVYRYLFSHPRPNGWGMPENAKDSLPPPINGAAHSWEIEYALGNLRTNPVYPWTPVDYKVSATMTSYFTHFIKTGNPNGTGLPLWTGNTENQPVRVMDINLHSHLMPEPPQRRQQHEFLDRLYEKESN
jgi:para-nitrobenzyl esterase